MIRLIKYARNFETKLAYTRMFQVTQQFFVTHFKIYLTRQGSTKLEMQNQERRCELDKSAVCSIGLNVTVQLCRLLQGSKTNTCCKGLKDILNPTTASCIVNRSYMMKVVYDIELPMATKVEHCSEYNISSVWALTS